MMHSPVSVKDGEEGGNGNYFGRIALPDGKKLFVGYLVCK